MRALFLVLFFLVGGVKNAVALEAAAGDENEAAAKPSHTFSPEVEAKMNDFLGKVTEAKRKLWQARMKKEIEGVVQVTGLGAEGVRKLETAAAAAIEICLKECMAKLSDSFYKGMGQQSEEVLLQMYGQILAQVETYAKADWFGDYVRPYEHEAWTGALQSTLTAEQAAAWQKELAGRREKFEKEIGDLLKPGIERARRQHDLEISAKSTEIKLTLGLPPDRAKKLDALAKNVVAQTVELWRLHAMKLLFSTDEEQRRQMLGENFYLGTEEKDLPSQQPAWRDGLAAQFSPEELKKLQTVRAERQAQRMRAMGQMLVALLDEKTALTEKQRQQLQPLAERVVKSQTMLFPVESLIGFFNYPPQVFFSAAHTLTEEEVKPILDPTQWEHWQKACTEGMAMTRSNRNALKKPAPVSDDVEQSIADFLYEKSVLERQRLLAVNLLKAEDAARIASVSGKALGRLQAAARGLAEQALNSWDSYVERNLRSQLQSVTAENVNERLASLENYTFQRNGDNEDAAKKTNVWDRTVETELTAEQQNVWKTALDERSAYRQKAIAAVILSEFSRKSVLTAEQSEKLEPIVTGFLKDYSDDIATMFSPSNSVPWFLQSYSMFIPFASRTEKELKTILRPEQWDFWAQCEEFGNCNSFWENIRQRHEQRNRVTH